MTKIRLPPRRIHVQAAASVKAKTEELLYQLLWVAEVMYRPTFRKLTESFEGWAYRTGLHRQLAELERRKLLEALGENPLERVYRLTEAGRHLALGQHEPPARWQRHWDGKWRMVLFDVPQKNASARARLQRSLAQRGFGYLQNSVWITPDFLSREETLLDPGKVNVESIILLEARPCAGETNQDIVAGAWNFDAINKAYERHGAVLDALPRHSVLDESAARRLQHWLRRERQAWAEANALDPFLPEGLHPSGYLGITAWQKRLEVMREAGRQMRSFKPRS